MQVNDADDYAGLPATEADPDLRLGMCCICLMEHPTVRSIVMLDVKASQPGFGCWGCLQCGLPMAGAVAVICDNCLDEYSAGNVKIGLACVGEPQNNQRIPLVSLTEKFEHDMTKHEDEAPDEDEEYLEFL